ncbi:MAG: TetR/AcrR family transcriptional regulator [Methanobacterium sp.]
MKKNLMDAALKEFAEKGYVAANTKAISERAGFSEMTLFRHFETKKNLFDQVLKENYQKMFNEFYASRMKIENSDDFLNTTIKVIYNILDNNFDFVRLVTLEGLSISEDIIADFMGFLIKSIDDVFPDSKVNTQVFCFNILSFIVFIILNKRPGRTFVNHEDAIEDFISYSNRSLQL